MACSFIELLINRKASRAFSEKKINDKIFDQLMHAAQLSASCNNNQSWRFLFLSEEDTLNKGRKALSKGNNWAAKAPLLVIGFSKPGLDCQSKDGREYYLFDLGMATQAILLQATELNLIARPMAGFSPEIIKNEFPMLAEYQIYIMIAIGYEGDIQSLEERQRRLSTQGRIRKPIAENFFVNNLNNLNQKEA